MVIDRGSAKHGALRDDIMAHEVEGIVRAGRDTRAEEWKSAEPPGEDTPQVALHPEGTAPMRGRPPGMTARDVEERSELARWLGRAVFPAEREEIMDHLRHQHAPDRVVEEVARAAPGVQFRSIGALWRSLHPEAPEESTRT
jgi:Protein of unknown function (DUF2795)